MGHYAEAQSHYVGLDGRERGPADELPGLAVAQLMRAAIAAQTDAEALPFMMQVRTHISTEQITSSLEKIGY